MLLVLHIEEAEKVLHFLNIVDSYAHQIAK